MEYSPAAQAKPRYATLVAVLTTWTGTLTARPSGSVMAPEIVPTEVCCAARFAATRTSRGSHLMYGLYTPTLVLEVRSVGIVWAIKRCRRFYRNERMSRTRSYFF